MQEDKNRVETILFTTGAYMTLDDLSKLTGILDLEYLKQLIEGLQKDYVERAGSLEIIQQGNQWKLGIRKQYLSVTEKMLKNSEMNRPTQETLAVIAYKNPAKQCDIIKIRGNKAYEHISELASLNFITAEKFGRTRLLKLTENFYSYFDVVADQLKSKFEQANLKEESKEKLNEETPDEAVEEKEISTEIFEDKEKQDFSNSPKSEIFEENNGESITKQ